MASNFLRAWRFLVRSWAPYPEGVLASKTRIWRKGNGQPWSLSAARLHYFVELVVSSLDLLTASPPLYAAAEYCRLESATRKCFGLRWNCQRLLRCETPASYPTAFFFAYRFFLTFVNAITGVLLPLAACFFCVFFFPSVVGCIFSRLFGILFQRVRCCITYFSASRCWRRLKATSTCSYPASPSP